jgi:hypothetical protein
MNAQMIKSIPVGLLFLLIFGLGFWLQRAGRPYGLGIFTVHKLAGLGTLIYLAVRIFRANQAAPLSNVQWAIVAGTALCFVTAILSGGLVSLEKPMPVVRALHWGMPFLAGGGTALLWFLNVLKFGL